MAPASDPGNIERELEQTRSRLDGHLSLLGEKLTPGQVVDDLMRYFRGREGAAFGRSLLDSVRANPLPAAITGIGLTWLMASNPAENGGGLRGRPVSGTRRVKVYHGAFSDGGHEGVAQRVRTAERDVVRGQGETGQAYSDRLDAARGQAIGLARHARESSESFSQRVGAALEAAEDALGRTAHDLQDQIGGAARRTGHALGQGSHAAGQAVSDSPLLLGAFGLAAGALLGVLLPQSEQEGAALEKIASQARNSARDLAQGATDKGSQVAQAVLEKGQESAGTHGLAGGRSVGGLVDAALSGSLARDAKEVATDALHAGDAAAREGNSA